MNAKQKLLLIQVYAHIAFICGLFVVPWQIALFIIIISQVVYVGFCGTAFYHRTVAHKNQINTVVEKILIILSWVGASGSAIAWAGTHRKHHRYSDTDKDPHCPMHMGRLRSYWYSSGNEDIMRYIPDLLRKKWYVFQHKYYFIVLFLVHALGIFILPFNWYWGLLIVPAFLMWFAGSSINVFCHDSKGPKNVNVLGYLHAGEGWHKNHHDHASDPFFRHSADWGGLIHKFIRLKG